MPTARRISRAEFERLWLVEEWGGQRVADHFGVNRSTVTKWARAFGMPLRTKVRLARRVVPRGDVPMLLDMWRCRVKASEIARHCGCNTRTVANTARRHGLGNRGKGSPTLFLTLEEYFSQRMVLQLARDAAVTRAALRDAEMVDSPRAFHRLTGTAA